MLLYMPICQMVFELRGPPTTHFRFLIIWSQFLKFGSFLLISFILMRSFMFNPRMDFIVEF